MTNEISQQEKKVNNLKKKYEKMGAMVPPPIKAEVYKKYAAEFEKLERLRGRED